MTTPLISALGVLLICLVAAVGILTVADLINERRETRRRERERELRRLVR